MSKVTWFRCQLRAINIEYSALVRSKKREAAFARMAKLCAERRVLMALIAVERKDAAMQCALEQAHSRPLRPALSCEPSGHASAPVVHDRRAISAFWRGSGRRRGEDKLQS